MPKFKKIVQLRAEMFHGTDGQARMTMLIVALRNFPNATKNTMVRTNISSVNVQFSPFRFCSVCAWRLLQTATAVRLLPSVTPALCWTQQQHISAIGPATSQRRNEHMTSEHTAGHAQFLVGTFVLTKRHSSTAVAIAGIFGEVEHFGQPTAVTCNYEGLAERNQKHRFRRTGGLSGVAFTEQQ